MRRADRGAVWAVTAPTGRGAPIAGLAAIVLAWSAACGPSSPRSTRAPVPGTAGDREAGESGGEGAGRDHGDDLGGGQGDPSEEGADDLDLAGEYPLAIPPDFPRPVVPEDNLLTKAKVELGRRLFYDRRLSGNETQACASCHEQARAFTDGRAVSPGSTGEHTRRSAMSLANVAYASALTWANPALRTLERQALVPMFGEAPVELGLSGLEDELLARLAAEPIYARLFPLAFPGEPEAVTLDHVVKALASFERTLLSGHAPYDRFGNGEPEALSASARRGMDLFFSERCECFHCHGGFAFSQSVRHVGTTFDELEFHNTGLYDLDGAGAYPSSDTGLEAVTGDPEDMGRFRAPSLRNIAVTAPYMHDGSIATLSEVIDHYARGGRKIEGGPNRGDGRASPLKSELINGFEITPEEKEDLIHFLESLTDEAFLENPAFANPWAEDRP